MTTTWGENNIENRPTSGYFQPKNRQIFLQKPSKDRISKSEGDAEFHSNLPTISEDFKDARASNEDTDDVFTCNNRPATSENYRLSAVHLPPLFNQTNLNNARTTSALPTCKRRPSTPRPVWSGNGVDLPRNSRQGKRISEVQNSNEASVSDQDVNNNSINNSFVRPSSSLPIRKSSCPEFSHRKPSVLTNQVSPKQLHPNSSDQMLPRFQKLTILNREKISSSFISSSGFLNSRRKKSC